VDSSPLPTTTPGPGAPLSSPGRLEAFSDGVIAIAITLLVLEIRVPEADGSLAERLSGQWPVYLAYLVSFVVVGATWLSHHHLIRDLKGVDHGLLLLNLLLLLVISFIPFPTKVVGEELTAHDVADQRTAAILYALTFLALAVAFNLVWWWAVRRRLVRDAIPAAAVSQRTRHYLIGPPAYAVSSALAFVSPMLSLAITGLIALTFLLPDTTKAAP